jgi:hypothetical protein
MVESPFFGGVAVAVNRCRRWAGPGLASLMLAGPGIAAAQSVTIRVTADPGGRPIAGALATLRDPSDRVVTRALADDQGRVRLEASPGRYRLRIDAIGYQGTTVDSVEITAGPGRQIAVELAPRPFDLGELVVASTRPVVCSLKDDQGGAVARLWEEARKALLATQLTRARSPMMELSTFERTLDRRGRIREERSSTRRGTSLRPFASIDPAVLRAEGYVLTRPDGVRYNAPDADVLLSEEFLDDHCFGVTTPQADRAGLAGLTFEPARHRDLPEVGGVLWLDEKTAELRHLEYRYLHVTFPSEAKGIGGRVEFERLPNGTWIVSRWVIRMPWLGHVRLVGGVRDSLLGYREGGGEARLLGGARPEPKAAPAAVSGRVVDSTTGAPLAGVHVSIQAGAFADTTDAEGRYRIASPARGDYLLTFADPRFALFGIDSVWRGARLERGTEDTVHLAIPLHATAVRTLCPEDSGRADRGVLIGRAIDSLTGAPLAAAAITLSLLESRVITSAAIGEKRTVMETRSNHRGYFRACGLPVGRSVTITVATAGGKSATARVTVAAPLVEVRVQIP